MSPVSALRALSPARRLVVLAALIASMFAGFAVSAGSSGATTPSQATQSVFQLLNHERSEHGLAPLRFSPAVTAAAHAHNVAMASHTLVAQYVPGEHLFRSRLALVGYSAVSYAAQVPGEMPGPLAAAPLLHSHLAQNAVNRAVILGNGATIVGIDVLPDPMHGRIWMTEVFVHPAAPASVPTPAPTSGPNPNTSADAGAILAQLNAERAANGRSGLVMDADLIQSAHVHNLAMAAANTMSHQLPGEPAFTDRIQAAGYDWGSAGENVGWNSVLTTAGATALETVMYNEQAPNDGHRQNILSTSYRNVGVDVYYDATHGKIWLTEDFGSPLS